MIVDCHVRIWASPDQLGPSAGAWLARHGGHKNLSADPSEQIAAACDVTCSLVWGFRSRHLGIDVPNSFLADHAAQHRDKAIGIAAIDPPEPDAMERLANVAERSEFAGITISPAAQAFHPADTRAMRVYEFCADRGLPVFVEPGADLAAQAVLEYARPHLFDEVARSFPKLKIVIASLGWPWVDETLALLAKQPRVYADFAALLRRGQEAYRALLSAHQRELCGKLFFGSDFPFATPAESIERLYRVNEVVHGTSMPAVPRESLRAILERDAAKELGLRRAEDKDLAP